MTTVTLSLATVQAALDALTDPDIGGHLTCTEADSVAALAVAAGIDPSDFLACHAYGDDDNDDTVHHLMLLPRDHESRAELNVVVDVLAARAADLAAALNNPDPSVALDLAESIIDSLPLDRSHGDGWAGDTAAALLPDTYGRTEPWTAEDVHAALTGPYRIPFHVFGAPIDGVAQPAATGTDAQQDIENSVAF